MTGIRSLAAGAVAVLCTGCVTNTEITVFDYATHDTPRVSVLHVPVYPDVGDTVTFNATAEAAADASLTTIGVQRLNGNGTVIEELDCSVSGPEAVCQFAADQELDVFYRAYVTDDRKRRRYSPGTYRFRYGHAEADDLARLPLRVPQIPNSNLDEDYRIDVLLVRDPSEPGQYAADTFFDDLTTFVNEGVLGDPVYRWRDNQIGFFLTNRPGRTASFYDGVTTACGQDPWLGADDIPEAGGMEVIGVLHRRSSQGQGSVLDPGVDFRDCAGFYQSDADVGTFSVRTGTAGSPVIGKHEFGHAAFGLGDEYFETDATRRVQADLAQANVAECCCQCDTPGIVTVDGGGDLQGDASGAQAECNIVTGIACFGNALAFGSGSLESCADFSLESSLACWREPQDRCPPLTSTCVRETAWLGNLPPPSYVDEQTGETKIIDPKRHNVFPTEDACEAARVSAEQHPGVENEDLRLAACRQLCGPEIDVACPCGTIAAWITDAIAEPVSAPHDDAMAGVTTPLPLHGGTCAWCVETSLCVRWQSAHADDFDPVEIWKACSNPPKWTRHFNNLVEYILTETRIRFPGAMRRTSARPAN